MTEPGKGRRILQFGLGLVATLALLGGIAMLCIVTGLGVDVAEPLCLAAVVGLVVWLGRTAKRG